MNKPCEKEYIPQVDMKEETPKMLIGNINPINNNKENNSANEQNTASWD